MPLKPLRAQLRTYTSPNANKLAALVLNADIYGEPTDQPALIILHGLFGSATNWRSLSKQMAREREIHCLDLRNHGRSPWADDMSYPAMAADVARYIHDQQLFNPVVLGHSMGGKAAMVLALQYPQLTSAIVVADIAPVNYSHNHDDYIQAMRRLDLGALSSRNEADRSLAADIPNAGERQLLIQNLTYEHGKLKWRINLDAITADMQVLFQFPEQDLAAYQRPTAFIHGRQSEYVLAKYQPTIDALFPDNQLTAIEDAGHWVHAEQPRAFLTVLAEFISQLN